MNVLGNTVNPSTSIDICTFDGFMLDSGLRISEGDGVLLTGSEALVWRPWMGSGSKQWQDTVGKGEIEMGTMQEQLGEGDGVGARGQGGMDGAVGTASFGNAERVMHGNDVKKTAGPDAGLVNAVGQFDVPDAAWGVFSVLWPRPGMLFPFPFLPFFSSHFLSIPLLLLPPLPINPLEPLLTYTPADMLIIGTGASIRPLAPATRKYLQGLGMRLEVLDTRNAASQFNLLATERGVQEIAAALVPVGFGKPG